MDRIERLDEALIVLGEDRPLETAVGSLVHVHPYMLLGPV